MKHTVPSTHKFKLARVCMRIERESRLSVISPRTSAVASITQILIYSIATDDYVSFKLLIVCFCSSCFALS